MPDTPAATASRQSGWATPLPSTCPTQNCRNSTTAHLPDASPTLSARDSTIPASRAFAIKGRADGQNYAGRGLLPVAGEGKA